MIIDDEKAIGSLLKNLLEFDGYEAIVSESPEGAEEKIRKFDIDLVLLDLRLSGVSGTDVCARLKKDATTEHIPIIMMSAQYDAARLCTNAGADDFISKPFEMEDLLTMIKNVLSLQREKNS